MGARFLGRWLDVQTWHSNTQILVLVFMEVILKVGL